MSTPSLGYHSDSQEGEETDSEECAEVVEDLAALEDEGVTGLSHSKYKVTEIIHRAAREISVCGIDISTCIM